MVSKAPKYANWDEQAGTAVPAWPTGNVLLDWVTGIGGLPKGRLVETYGPESSGKSSLALQTASHAWQTQRIPSIYVDFEDAFDPMYARALGLDQNGLQLSESQTLEAMFEELAYVLAHNGTRPHALFIVDSVAAARSAAALATAGQAADNTAGMVKAKIWADQLQVFVRLLADAGVTMVLVNQLRDNIQINQGWVPPAVAAMQPKTRTPGGRALKFYASLRIEFIPGADIKEPRYDPVTTETNNVAVGKKVRLKVTKNKVAEPPWRSTVLQIRDGVGFDLAQNLLDFAQVHGIVDRKAGVWTFPGELSPTGEPFVIKAQDGHSGDAIAAHFLRQRPNIAATIQAQVMAKLDMAAAYVADRPPDPTADPAETEEIPE